MAEHDPAEARSRGPESHTNATVLICTYNRAERLAETLDSLARTVAPHLRWEVIVVDNNSTDCTRAVVRSRAAEYPVPLHYLFESRQGKSHALNLGLASTDADIVAFTDDDVRVPSEWLMAACQPLLDDRTVDYTGGPVQPIWEIPCPTWVGRCSSELWGALAILDYGADAFCFEDRQRVPVGANMAVRRSLTARIGGFYTGLGRRGGTLLGQEQAEFFYRSRAAGARGRYVPAMTLEHHVPAHRLSREYFRRWWYWKGISRFLLEQLHPVTELGVDLTDTPHVAGIPRFMLGSAVRSAAGWIAASCTGDVIVRARHEMMLCYFGGYFKAASAQRLKRPSNVPAYPAPHRNGKTFHA